MGRASKTVDGRVTVPVAVRTKLFGTLRGRVALPVTRTRRPRRGALAAVPAAPRPAPGRARAPDESARARGAPRCSPPTAAASTASRARRRSPAARPRRATRASASRRAYDDRLGGRPSAELRFGSRRIAATKARRGRSVRSTIRPGLQRATVAALGDRLGGIAVVRPRDGAVLALSGLAVSAPQPPGSTFKIITAAAALQAKVARLSSTYPVRTSATLSGVTLRNAGNESCGGSLTNSFTHSCNSVFAPLGAKLGAKRMVAAAERFGFNSTPRVPAAKPSRFPKDLKDALAVGSAAIGQERVVATPRADGGGRRRDRRPRRLSIAPDRALRQGRPQARRVAARRRPGTRHDALGRARRDRDGRRRAGRRGRRQDRHRRAAPDRERPAGPEEHRRVVRRASRPRARRRSPSRSCSSARARAARPRRRSRARSCRPPSEAGRRSAPVGMPTPGHLTNRVPDAELGSTPPPGTATTGTMSRTWRQQTAARSSRWTASPRKLRPGH